MWISRYDYEELLDSARRAIKAGNDAVEKLNKSNALVEKATAIIEEQNAIIKGLEGK